MVMDNKQNDRKSILRVEKIEFEPGIRDNYFSTRYLENF
jgi:hypothetical protein